jgi:hypothetical protein
MSDGDPLASYATDMLERFNTFFKVEVNRFEFHTYREPNFYCVGFLVSSKTGSKNMNYVDTTVSVSDLPLNADKTTIIDAAWVKLRDAVRSWADPLITNGFQEDTTYVPTIM